MKTFGEYLKNVNHKKYELNKDIIDSIDVCIELFSYRLSHSKLFNEITIYADEKFVEFPLNLKCFVKASEYEIQVDSRNYKKRIYSWEEGLKKVLELL